MRTNFEIYIIEKVKKIRKEKGISQLELADGIGVSAGFIGKVESSNTSAKYNLQHLNLIATFLKVSPKIFLPDEPII
jgi:transcriptional regulator with XRE-family HTH domain